jgi:exonuclease III
VDAGPPDAGPQAGTLSVVTYNVAGLPQGISASKPAVNTKLISPKLNAFDIVAVQEDFAFHADLISMSTLPYKSTPKTMPGLGDGLNILSKIPFREGPRVGWAKCNGLTNAGSDCLAPKGFHRAELTLGGEDVHVYNLHADASSTPKDQEARRAQVAQLLALINVDSAGKALIVLGDTNMDAADEDQVQSLLTGGPLTDACRALNCAEPDRIDRIMFRNSATLTWTPSNFLVDLTGFLDKDGAQLSDHEPVTVSLAWKR